MRKWLLLCLCLEFHHKAWRCRHETDDGLKIFIAKLKKAILFGKKMVSACVLFHGNRTKNALLIDIFQ